MWKSATVPSLRVTQHSPSAWAGFAPKLTMMHTVAEKSCLSSRSILRRVLTNLLEHGCAIDQHDTGVQILVKVSVALHDVLKRSVADSIGFFVDGAWLEQQPRATETSELRVAQGLLVVFRARLLPLLLLRLFASAAAGCSLDMVTH